MCHTSFQVIIHCEGFAVKYGVGVLADPIAKYEHSAGMAEHQVQFYVTVAEYEEVYIGM